ncbi:VOC family protein [Flagellimonas pacifica]|uniref:Catechol 2,3-dioxygenase n=1 Tax=Flagellimonas pacifica TaxID=1247520 RepID=A0A285MTM4_9FLAO|nr:VOC family protein [Allomuricauda parva]SNZ00532.1 Catechol 2,3-dioxygenase [Allomuricauda parva]
MKHFIIICLLLTTTVGLCQAENEFDKSSISIGVIASDLKTSLDFYTNIIGMKQTGEFPVGDTLSKKTGLTNGVAFDVKVLKLHDDPNATEYKLLSFKNPKSKSDTYINEGNGMRYITLFYKSLDAVIQRLKDNNINFLSEEPTHIPDGRRFVLVQDPDGVFVELIGK